MDNSYMRKEVVRLLRTGGAHASFDDIVSGFPVKNRGLKPAGSPHTAWQLLEHMRIAQWDIVEYTRNPEHVSPEFPAAYWPTADAPPDAKAWNASIAAFKQDLRSMQQLVEDTKNDLFATLPHANGATIFGQALLVVDHNSYHLGQLMTVRKSLGG